MATDFAALAEHGKKKILACRLLKDAGTKTGAKLLLQVNHTIRYSRAVDSVKTKDGTIGVDGGLEVTLSLTAISSKDEVNTMLKQSVIDGDKVEFWEIDLATATAAGECDALYMQGLLSNWETPANVDSLIEISSEATIDGVPQAGKVTITDMQAQEIQYAFRNLDIVPAV